MALYGTSHFLQLHDLVWPFPVLSTTPQASHYQSHWVITRVIESFFILEETLHFASLWHWIFQPSTDGKLKCKKGIDQPNIHLLKSVGLTNCPILTKSPPAYAATLLGKGTPAPFPEGKPSLPCCIYLDLHSYFVGTSPSGPRTVGNSWKRR